MGIRERSEQEMSATPAQSPLRGVSFRERPKCESVACRREGSFWRYKDETEQY